MTSKVRGFANYGVQHLELHLCKSLSHKQLKVYLRSGFLYRGRVVLVPL